MSAATLPASGNVLPGQVEVGREDQDSLKSLSMDVSAMDVQLPRARVVSASALHEQPRPTAALTQNDRR
jgi:hypothetical protein